MLTDKEADLVLAMNYQVLQNGMMGWLSNHYYVDVFDYLEILKKRNDAIDDKVATLFQKATISGLKYHQYKGATFIPEFKRICDDAEKTIKECEKQYQEIADDFVKSYGLQT